jgi:four helix bundle protein
MRRLAGTVAAEHARMNAKTLEELQVFQKAVDASAEISAIIERPSFERYLRLREQIGCASERVVSAISEGFEQSTDRHFAQYLYRAKGSSREIRSQLIVAQQRRLIAESDRLKVSARYEEIAKMLAGLIRHLEREDRKHRR